MAIFLRSKSSVHAYWYSQLCLQNRRGIPSLPNDCQQHSASPKMMPLALAGARTDSTMRYSYNSGRGQFPRTRIGIVHKTRRAHSACSSMRRGFCTLVLFIHIVVYGTMTSIRTPGGVLVLNQHTIHYDINIHDSLTRAYSVVQIGYTTPTLQFSVYTTRATHS